MPQSMLLPQPAVQMVVKVPRRFATRPIFLPNIAKVDFFLF
jgi:hypothetical protein